ncbi:hypothetical protein GCM10009760_54040 [Kitasatospora kazusensis]|uniref:Peptidase S74 domain-containing protein n=1 Tax=Kitasatospora kazusensis TaxID=407974 RepID=A0ABN3A6Y3_9ACTN
MRIFRRRSTAADRSAPARPPAGARGSGAVAPAGAVNGHTVLETVAALPVSTWRYLWEPEDVRHLGPMAQDWHAAFGFNRDDTTIPVVDGLGVSLVCIQALNRRLDELTAEVGRLRESVGGPPQDGPPADTGAARPSPTRPGSSIPLETP